MYVHSNSSGIPSVQNGEQLGNLSRGLDVFGDEVERLIPSAARFRVWEAVPGKLEPESKGVECLIQSKRWHMGIVSVTIKMICGN
jgi:hypothetical protein